MLVDQEHLLLSCLRKRKFTEQEANTEIKRLNPRHGLWKWKKYRCDYCPCWHIAHDDNYKKLKVKSSKS